MVSPVLRGDRRRALSCGYGQWGTHSARAAMRLLGGFALIAPALAAVGIYGATSRDIGLVMRQAAALAGLWAYWSA